MGYHQNAVTPANPSGANTTNGYIFTPHIDALAAQGPVGFPACCVMT